MNIGVEISEIDENELIHKIKNGDTDCFQLLAKRYLSVINYYISVFNCSENDREDLTQEALLALYSAAGVYDFSSSSFSTFASVCIKRSIISSIRRISGKKNVPQSAIVTLDEITVDSEQNPESKVINKESYIHFSDKIRLLLSSFEYSVLTAYLRLGSYTEIADALN
ncbi:MAG: sigma-70 family RNA polymerase sigma factor, partial [Acutalibacteraceae bacterium]|nr:sigma-70 family RNA polymerase sigma factor [Acutalibacteraceae bacterium]